MSGWSIGRKSAMDKSLPPKSSASSVGSTASGAGGIVDFEAEMRRRDAENEARLQAAFERMEYEKQQAVFQAHVQVAHAHAQAHAYAENVMVEAAHATARAVKFAELKAKHAQKRALAEAETQAEEARRRAVAEAEVRGQQNVLRGVLDSAQARRERAGLDS